MDVYYSPDFVGAAYSFETTRKASWIADSLKHSPIPGIDLVSPESLTQAAVEEVHDAAYVEAVKTGEPRYLAESQGFVWDLGMWPMVLSSNGGVVAAALSAMKTGVAGSLSSGLHHARRGSGAGFCTFNGLVIAANAAIAAGAASVLILDLDAHCGGGTASLIADDPRVWQLDVAVDSFDFYGQAVEESTEGRIRLRLVHQADRYLDAVEGSLAQIERPGPAFDLCLYNAGMDPFEGCSTGGLAGMTKEILATRERMVFDRLRTLRIPTAFVMAGGYLGRGLDAEGLVALHRLTLAAAAGAAHDLA